MLNTKPLPIEGLFLNIIPGHLSNASQLYVSNNYYFSVDTKSNSFQPIEKRVLHEKLNYLKISGNYSLVWVS
jgi:hypothetical protein